MMKKRYTLPRTKIIKRRNDFQHIYHTGTSYTGRRMILCVLRTPRFAGKVAFAAGKKLGCAAQRSRMKRLMREAYRHMQHELCADAGLLLIARAGMEGVKMQDVQQDLRALLRRAKLFVHGGTHDEGHR